MFRQVKDFVLDLLFPKRCVACGQHDTWFCAYCLRDIRFADQKIKKEGQLQGLFYVSAFADPSMRVLIKAWKYEFLRDLENPILSIVSNFCSKYGTIFPKNSVLVPIPLHKKRLLWRGFNQAEVLAKILALSLEGEVASILLRPNATEAQAQLDHEEKKKNIAGAFSMIDNAAIFDRPIILVDDCYTTGSTMQECAKVLRQSGAKEVWGFVLARG